MYQSRERWKWRMEFLLYVIPKYKVLDILKHVVNLFPSILKPLNFIFHLYKLDTRLGSIHDKSPCLSALCPVSLTRISHFCRVCNDPLIIN